MQKDFSLTLHRQAHVQLSVFSFLLFSPAADIP